jgi:hypothetical protein
MLHVGHVRAPETNIQETDVSTSRDGNVMLLVNGTRRAATVDETLRLINKIRWNACQIVTCSCGYKKTQKHHYMDASYDENDASVAAYHQMKCQFGATTHEKHTFGAAKEDPDNDQKH